MIKAQNITKTVGTPNAPQDILKNVSIDVQEGEFLAITGRSGSGKTTLLHILSTLAKPNSGSLLYGENDLCTLDERQLNEIRKTHFSVIFQFHHLFPYLTALENCLLPFMNSFKPVSREVLVRAKECLARVGLAGKESALPGKLSGGEQQRVAIARALVQDAKLLFADEPTGSLDKATGSEIMQLLSSLRDAGLTIVMVTHEPSYATLGDRIIEMEDGRVVA